MNPEQGNDDVGWPTFVIEEGGRYYVAIAVLEYNEAGAQSDQQREGVAAMRKLFQGEEMAAAPSSVQAKRLSSDWQSFGCMNTNPPIPRA